MPVAVFALLPVSGAMTTCAKLSPMLSRATDSIFTVPLVPAHTFVPWLPSEYSTVAALPVVCALVTGYVAPALGLAPVTLIASACGTLASRMHTDAYLAAPSGPL